MELERILILEVRADGGDKRGVRRDTSAKAGDSGISLASSGDIETSIGVD